MQQQLYMVCHRHRRPSAAQPKCQIELGHVCNLFHDSARVQELRKWKPGVSDSAHITETVSTGSSQKEEM